MRNEQISIGSGALAFHELMSSISFASMLVVGMFLYAPKSSVSSLFRMEVAVKSLLHIHQTDLNTGYWAFFLPVIGLAVCFLLLLRMSRQSRVTREVRRVLTGIIAISLPGACWLCETYLERRRYGWNVFLSVQLYEFIIAVAFVLLYSYKSRMWPVPLWGNILILALHFGFWFWQFGRYSLLLGIGGPFMLLPLVGVVSTVAWLLYLQACAGSGAKEWNFG